MNMRDSEVVCGLLAKAGYKITDNSAKADVIEEGLKLVKKRAGPVNR